MALIPLYEWLPEQQPPLQLFVLMHGEQSGPDDMAGLAAALRAAFPASVILAPASGRLGEHISAGYQWFAPDAQNDAQFAEDIAAAMSDVLDFVRQAQQRFDLTPAQTALVGFSQGAVMALEAAIASGTTDITTDVTGSSEAEAVAGRILVFSGRFSSLPTRLPSACTFHFLHGQDDTVVSVDHARAAHTRVGTLQGDSTIDVASHVGHVLHPALIARAIVRLQTCVPLRSWQEAMGVTDDDAQDSGAPHGVTLH